LIQEAWRVVWHSRKWYDPRRSALATWLWNILPSKLGRYASRELAVVSVGSGHGGAGQYVAKDMQFRVEHRDCHDDAAVGPIGDQRRAARRDTPEQRALDREADRRLQTWRETVRGVLLEILAAWPEEDRVIVWRLGGLDGDEPERPGPLAERLGISVTHVYRVHSRMEHELWRSGKLYILHKRARWLNV